MNSAPRPTGDAVASAGSLAPDAVNSSEQRQPNILGAGCAGWLVPLAILLIGHLATVLGVHEGAASLGNPDEYTRLVRVQELWERGNWFDPALYRVNPPLGHLQHWTRPMDALLLLGGAAGSLFVDFREALLAWALLFPVLLHIAALFVLRWAVRPFLNPTGQLMAGILLAAHGSEFAPGNVDHHGLLALLFLANLGLMLRVLLDPERLKWRWMLAAVGALSLWVSIELLLFIALFTAVAATRWLVSERQPPGGTGTYCLGLALACACALVLEQPPARYLTLNYDALSAAHVVLFGWLGLLMLLVERAWRLIVAHHRELSGDGIKWRFLLLMVAAALFGVGIWALAPGFFESPLARVDPLYRVLRMERIEELQTPWAYAGVKGGLRPISFPLHLLGTSAVVLALFASLGWRLSRGWKPARPTLQVQLAEPRRWAWGFVAMGTLAYTALTCHQIRWGSDATLLSVLPYAFWGQLLVESIARGRSGLGLRLARVTLVLGLCVGFQVPEAIAHRYSAAGGSVSPSAAACDVAALADVLNHPEALQDSGTPEPHGTAVIPLKLLLHPDYAPEILFRTAHAVFSIPNHRYQAGFVLSHEILSAPPQEAVGKLRQAAADLVCVCRASPNWSIYGAGDNLYTALVEGQAPAGLVEVTPTGKTTGFRLYRLSD